jgi:N-acetylmuramoyl-L-alanine amidase
MPQDKHNSTDFTNDNAYNVAPDRGIGSGNDEFSSRLRQQLDRASPLASAAPPRPTNAPDDTGRWSPPDPALDEFSQRLATQARASSSGVAAPADRGATRIGYLGDLDEDVNHVFARPDGLAPAAPSVSESELTPDDAFSERLSEQLDKNDDAVAESSDSDEDAPQAPVSPGPVGTGQYLVRAGDCISSIASDHGHFWETLWNEPANTALREMRQDPNTLFEGDRVTVPPIRQKATPGMTELRHRFLKKGQPEALRLRILEDDEPRANEPYVLDVDGEESTGTTDANGQVLRQIKPTARRAKLTVGEGDDATEYVFNLGELDPLAELSGVQGRLNSLGFDCGPADNTWGPRTRRAIEMFQAHYEMPVNGRPDEPTKQKLREVYGC